MEDQPTELNIQQNKHENIDEKVDSNQKNLNNISEIDNNYPQNEPIIEKPVKGKKFFFWAFIIIVLLAILSSAYILFKDNFVSLFVKYGAEVSLVSGNIEVSKTEGIWTEIKSGDNVEQGDIVRVNGDGRAIITLDDGSAVRLADDSKITLTSLNPSNIIITNEAGEVYTRVVKADRTFIVKVVAKNLINH